MTDTPMLVEVDLEKMTEGRLVQLPLILVCSLELVASWATTTLLIGNELDRLRFTISSTSRNVISSFPSGLFISAIMKRFSSGPLFYCCSLSSFSGFLDRFGPMFR